MVISMVGRRAPGLKAVSINNKMDVAEWKERYQEVLRTVENIHLKTQSEAEKNQNSKESLY